MMTWFGADPGGVDAFGVALLRESGSFDTEIVSARIMQSGGFATGKSL